MKLFSILFGDFYRASWRSVLRLWKPMAGWMLAVYAVFTALLVPVLGDMLNRGVFRGKRLVIGNEELFGWFLSPAGLFYLFLALLIILTEMVVRYAGLFQIITDDLMGNEISVRATALHIAPRIPLLIRLCAVTILGAVLLLIPLLAGLWGIYYIFLTGFDVNYYISEKPADWYSALIAGAIWGGVWLIFTLITVAGILPGLPAYLDKKRTLAQSVREGWNAPVTERLKFIKAVAIAVLIWFFLRIITDASLLFIFIWFTGWIQAQFDSLRLLAGAAGSYLFLSWLTGTIISFIGFSLISTIITKFYYSFSYPSVPIVVPEFKKLQQKTLNLVRWWIHPIRGILLIVMIIAGGVITGLVMIDDTPGRDQVTVISHRAGPFPYPENSLAALEESIRLNADYAEIDVQLTRDGTAIVIHDADFMRAAGDQRNVADVHFRDVQNLMLLGKSGPESERRLSSLADFLERSNGRIRLMIELKYYGSDPELAAEVIQLVRDHEMEDQVIIMSLHRDGIRQVQEAAPELKTAYVSAAAMGDISLLNVDYLAVNYQNITPQMVSNIKNRQIGLFAWTVNQSEDIVEAIEKGADGIITDQPERAIMITSELAQLTIAERFLLQFGLLIVDGSTSVEEILN